MNNFFLMAIAAITIFSSCNKAEEPTVSENKNLKFSINFASMRPKTMEPSANGYKPSTVDIELCDASGNPLTYRGRLLTAFDVANANNSDYILHDIPANTTKIKVYVNYAGQSGISINDLQTLTKVPYYGDADITATANIDPIDGNVIWEADIMVNIRLSRFEVKGYGPDELKIKLDKPMDNTSASEAEAIAEWGNADVTAAKHRALKDLKVLRPALVPSEVAYTYSLTYTNGSGYYAQPEVADIYMNSFKLTPSGAIEFNDNSGSGSWDLDALTKYAGTHNKMWNTWSPTSINTVAGFNLYPQNVSITDDQMKAKQNGMPHVILKLTMGDGSTRYVTIRQFKTGAGIVKSFIAANAYQMLLKDVVLGLYNRKLTVSASWNGTTVVDPEEPEEPVDPTDPDPEDENDGKDLLVVKIEIQEWTIIGVTPIL